MTTEREIREFAHNNGMEVRSNVNMAGWVKFLNENDGICPVGKRCPCTICNAGLMKRVYYSEDGKELGDAVEALEKVRNKLDSTRADEMDDALKDATEIVKEDVKNHSCPRCSEYMEGLQRKLVWLREECRIDGNSCAEEVDLTLGRISKMQETFLAADDGLRGSKREDTENADSRLDRSGFSPFHDCVQENLVRMEKDGSVGRGDRMCVASKMCKKEPLGIEEAIKECVR